MDESHGSHEIFLSIVVPLFNEADGLEHFWEELTAVLTSLTFNCQVIFVDDGSVDGSDAVLDSLEGPIEILSLVGNRGQMAAIDAGYRAARGKWIVTMDADLQHPPELIPKMLSVAERDGTDVVMGQVVSRKGSGPLKKLASRIYYPLTEKIFGLALIPSAGDFRLISERVLSVIKLMPPGSHFWRGLIPNLGFSLSVLPFVPRGRSHGHSKYTFTKMFGLAMQSFIGPGSRPTVFLVSLAGIGLVISMGLVFGSVIAWASGSTVSGWASTVGLILMSSMLQTLLLMVVLWNLQDLVRVVNRFPPYVIRSNSKSQVATISENVSGQQTEF